MRNIFLFIRRYITFLSFVVLQILALLMLFNFNRFHRAVGLGLANEITGTVNTQVDKLDDYFQQGVENRRIHRINDSLLNMMKENFFFPDTAERNVSDTVMIDTTKALRLYRYRDAKVVYNTVNSDQNYLQLNRGSKLGIRDDMAVISSDLGVVGVVVAVSPNFSEVMSLLHNQMTVSAALKKTGTTGNVTWDGKDPRFVYLRGISQSVELKVGDTVETSKYSYTFPPGRIIGTIAEAKNDPATGFYIIKVRTAVNFATLQQVHVVENLLRDEQTQLDKDTKKKMEQQKNQRR